MFCPDCGSQVAEGRKFCGKCGGQLSWFSGNAKFAAVAADRPAEAPLASREPLSLRMKVAYVLGALVIGAGVVSWWWFQRPAPAYQVQDPGVYPVEGSSANGKTGKWGFIDADGKTIVEPTWDGIASREISGQLVAFSEGLCGVRKDGKWGYIDTRGNLAIPAQFDSAAPFIGGLGRVELGDQVGYINKTGRYVINPQFNQAGDFHDGLAAAKADGGWGFINKTGTFVIKAQFPYVELEGFSNGLAGVCQDKCGYVNRSGIFVIKPQFNSLNTFSEGMAAVRINNKWGYIDTAGKIVINPQFDQVFSFTGGLATVAISGKTGTIDKQGKYVLNPGQLTVAGKNGDLQPALSSDGASLITKDGKWILKPTKGLVQINAISGKVFYGILGGPGEQVVPISMSGKVLAGWYKGGVLDTLAQDIENNMSALSSIKLLMTAEFNYASSSAMGYAESLAKLGSATAAPDDNHAGLIDAALATGTKDGYQFTVTIPTGSMADGVNRSYLIVAKPLTGHVGGTLCADNSSATIRRALPGEECTANSPPANAP